MYGSIVVIFAKPEVRAIKRLVCAFTGHRPKFFPWGYDESDSRCVELRKPFFQQIRCLVVHGYTDFLSGMAIGVDIWAAQAVLDLREEHPKLKLHCILPCVGQEKMWDPEIKKLYYSIIKQADSRVYVNRNYYKNCMLDRNRFMVDHSDLLLAVYAGISRSGTASTVDYARNQGKEILILDPLTNNIVHEDPK